MTWPLSDGFLRRPIAHRGLHDLAAGAPENSAAAMQAAIDGFYGIELDVQPSADGAAMVFHDYALERLTELSGPISGLSSDVLSQTTLAGTDQTIPTLAEILRLVDGQVPVLVEIKDQTLRPDPSIGPLESAVAAALAGYDGPVAVMSFNPDSMAAFARHAPETVRGLTTCAFDSTDWPLDSATRARLRDVSDFDRVGASFISHDHGDLDNGAVGALKARGVPVLCWTVRTPEDEALARRIADNVTFEGYLPAVHA